MTWNEGVGWQFGHPAEAVGPGPAWWMDQVHPDDRDGVFGGIHAAFNRVSDACQDEYRFRPTGGGHAEILDRGRIARDERGKAVRMVGSMVDLTERKHAERMARFVAAVSPALADLTDSVSTKQKVAGLSVPAFADWWAVDMLDDGGDRRRVPVTHADPAWSRAYRALIQMYPPRDLDPHSAPHVILTGQPGLMEDVTDALMAATAPDDDKCRLLRRMGLR